MPRLTPIVLNSAEHQLFYTVSNVQNATRVLRNLGRLEKKDTQAAAFDLVRTGDTEAIAVFILAGLEHERNTAVTSEKVLGWLDTEMSKRPETFGDEIQMPILEALKAAGQISFVYKPQGPTSETEAGTQAGTGTDGARPTEVTA